MNPRYKAFNKLTHGRVWPSELDRRRCYESFMADMVAKYTGCLDLLDGYRKISDHEDFTAFIQKFVDDRVGA